mmetsp:Transcript_28711/g.53938  ORF Transcript_28711/g.53938 Transcript_28711/m.53938 type:complete len:324 (-) Transcript_28711:645-1616(-)
MTGSKRGNVRSRPTGRRNILSSETPYSGTNQDHFRLDYNNVMASSYVEDYGDNENNNDDGKQRGLFGARGVLSGPFICLWSCSRTVFSPAVVSAVAMITSFVTMQFVVDSIIVTFASGLTIVIALLVLLQQRKLRRLGSLRREHNDLRRQANFFVQERERLHRTLDRIDQKMAELHYVPQELHRLSKKHDQDVDRLTHIVQEKKLVQEKIRKKLQQRVMQQLLGVVVNADKDSDFSLSPNEVDVLVVRLGLIEGIEFNEKRFREMLAEDPSIHSVFKMLRSMQEGDEEYEYGNPVFVCKQERLLEDKGAGGTNPTVDGTEASF